MRRRSTSARRRVGIPTRVSSPTTPDSKPTCTEGPYDEATRDLGVNRLISTMLDHGVGPNQNIYAELGTTWWSLMSRPDEAAHLIGKLLRNVGEDNVLWGSDSIFYGSPQDQIQTFRAFQISEEFQERLRLSRADRRDQAEGARAERVALAQRRPDHRAVHLHT